MAHLATTARNLFPIDIIALVWVRPPPLRTALGNRGGDLGVACPLSDQKSRSKATVAFSLGTVSK